MENQIKNVKEMKPTLKQHIMLLISQEGTQCPIIPYTKKCANVLPIYEGKERRRQHKPLIKEASINAQSKQRNVLKK